ncbi:hypothetical protein [Catenibacterium mitsuokai]|jgi:hypothetical protein|uniref:hypothetical protein n=1 Tax=uncultured Catenibacterium sp. TaxID=286142 RepID=UPI00205B2A9B|nr:hypothetical protein [Catenibacterium mitsuokai]MEE0335234.1 hypothetical protein [Catenibacterium mitsuokai]DAP46575.1 MAG TPA: hypothetical protein [Caudoviricetes sp.]
MENKNLVYPVPMCIQNIARLLSVAGDKKAKRISRVILNYINSDKYKNDMILRNKNYIKAMEKALEKK